MEDIQARWSNLQGMFERMNLTETDITASICRESFYEFLVEFWDVMVPERMIDNWHIKYLCDILQEMAERVFKGLSKTHDLIVNVPPGQTKSTIFSVAFPAWTWIRFPTARHICGSHAYDLGMDLSRKCRDIVLTTERRDHKSSYADCFPDIRMKDDQNTKGYFANTMGGMRKSVTAGGKSPIGFHAHFLIIDDPIDPQKAVSEVEIKTANDWMNETLPSRVIDKRITPIILIQQRLHQNDQTGNWLSKSKSEGDLLHICLPADCSEFEVKPKGINSRYRDDLLDPIRLPRSVLKQIRMKGEYAYASQYGQNPVPLGGGMFRVDRIRIDRPPIDRYLRKVVRYWDKAATAGDGAYTVGAKIAKDTDGKFWILDIVRGQWDSSERERTIAQTAEMDGRKVQVGVEQEPGSGGKESAEATVRMLAGYWVRLDRPSGNKALRADPFSSQVNAHNVSIAKGEWNHDYIEELRYFPMGTFKDQVDASSGGFNMLEIVRTRVGAF